MKKPVVYMAAPYTKGDPAINVHSQLNRFSILLDTGLVTPIAPLLTHFAHLQRPRRYEDWIQYDLELIELCDACLRLPATSYDIKYHVWDSPGADGEVKRFMELGRPVFYDIHTLLEWAKLPEETRRTHER